MIAGISEWVRWAEFTWNSQICVWSQGSRMMGITWRGTVRCGNVCWTQQCKKSSLPSDKAVMKYCTVVESWSTSSGCPSMFVAGHLQKYLGWEPYPQFNIIPSVWPYLELCGLSAMVTQWGGILLASYCCPRIQWPGKGGCLHSLYRQGNKVNVSRNLKVLYCSGVHHALGMLLLSLSYIRVAVIAFQ